MIKLCYKEYDYKLSLKAIKGFKKDTGEDLMFTLSMLLSTWSDGAGMDIRNRINSLYSVCDFELAAYAFYHLIKGSKKDIPLDEIEDSMFRVGIIPNDIDDDLSSPWPLVLVKVAQDIESDFLEGASTKKSGTSE